MFHCFNPSVWAFLNDCAHIGGHEGIKAPLHLIFQSGLQTQFLLASCHASQSAASGRIITIFCGLQVPARLSQRHRHFLRAGRRRAILRHGLPTGPCRTRHSPAHMEALSIREPGKLDQRIWNYLIGKDSAPKTSHAATPVASSFCLNCLFRQLSMSDLSRSALFSLLAGGG